MIYTNNNNRRANDDSPALEKLSEWRSELERVFYMYIDVLESQECVPRTLCELGSYSRTYNIPGKEILLRWDRLTTWMQQGRGTPQFHTVVNTGGCYSSPISAADQDIHVHTFILGEPSQSVFFIGYLFISFIGTRRGKS